MPCGTGKRIGEAMGRLFAVAQSGGSGEIVTLQMESGDGLKEDFIKLELTGDGGMWGVTAGENGGVLSWNKKNGAG